MTSLANRYAALPTPAKLLLILTAALLPIGIALVGIANSGIREANNALRGQALEQAGAAARDLESLIARNVLSLRIAANGALAQGPSGACDRARRSLAIVPAVVQRFSLTGADRSPICMVDGAASRADVPALAPGAIGLAISPTGNGVDLHVGVVGGIASASLTTQQLREALRENPHRIESLTVRSPDRELSIVRTVRAVRSGQTSAMTSWPIGNGELTAHISMAVPRITTMDRLLLLLPLLMWVMAATITWLVVSRLLIRPLRRLERSVIRLQPGMGTEVLPRRLGPATEIQQLRDAFARSIDRIELSEQEMASALEGQRRLVREVHHRVKNNLQVVASLLNIHGRTAQTAEARAAYAAIGRRVSALSIVHRNHFAEMEENRGISLRPLLAELSAELRAGAPAEGRALHIDLDVETIHTTQDVAVSVAFLITEIVEFAMLHRPEDGVEVSLRRSSELTARLTLSSPVLVPDDADAPEKVQFERIIGGLAKQLRSPLERKLGRYSVDLPVFPAG